MMTEAAGENLPEEAMLDPMIKNKPFENYIVKEVTQKMIKDYPFLLTENIQVEILNKDHMNKKNKVDYQLAIRSNNDLLGDSTLDLNEYDKRNTYIGKKTIMIRTTAFRWMLRSKSVIHKEEKLTSANVEKIYMIINGMPRNVLSDWPQLSGKSTVGTIGKETFITMPMIKNTPIIYAGDRVVARAKRDMIEISYDAEALDSGGVGDVIHLKGVFEFKSIVKGDIRSSRDVEIRLGR